MTLTEIEKQVVKKIANSIIDDCVGDNPDNPSSCVKDTSAGVLYIVDALYDLPNDHKLKPHISNISELANNIKQDTVKWSTLRGIT